MKHTYQANGIKYFAFVYKVSNNNNGKITNAWNFHIFDDEGYEWINITHTTMAFLKNIFPYIFDNKTIWTIDDTQNWTRRPISNPKNPIIKGNAEIAYTLENIKGKFGIDIELLNNLSN